MEHLYRSLLGDDDYFLYQLCSWNIAGTPTYVCFRARVFGTDADLLYTWRSTLCKGSISVHDRPDLEAHINLHNVHMSKEQQRVNIMCVHLLPDMWFFFGNI